MELNSKQREQKVRVTCSIAQRALNGQMEIEVKPPEDAKSYDDLNLALDVLGVRRIDTLFVGELDLAGNVCPVRELSQFSTVLQNVVVPFAQREEAAHFFPDARVFAVGNLQEAVDYCRAIRPEVRTPWKPDNPELEPLEGRLGEVLDKAVDYLSAGYGAVYLEGAHGSGKTRIARRIASKLLPLEYVEAVELSRIHSFAGMLDGGLATKRPFRAPHHSVTEPGMIGKKNVRPGEVHLSRYGVLFLDEAPEFRASVLKSTKQALMADNYVVLAGNPCACPFATRECRCTPERLARHRERVAEIVELFDAIKITI